MKRMRRTHNKQWFARTPLRFGECMGRCFLRFWVVILLLIVGFVIRKQMGNTGVTPNTVTRNSRLTGVVLRQVSSRAGAFTFLPSHEAVQIATTELDLAPGVHSRVGNVSLLADKWNNVAGPILERDRAMAGR
jgi:hypothetical protein